MELWIRSQDKEDLIKVDNLGLAYEGKYAFVDNDRIDDKFYICQFTNNFHAKLGVYATKERALEVLDEIQKMLDGRWIEENIPSASMQNVFPIMLYEMPEQ